MFDPAGLWAGLFYGQIEGAKSIYRLAILLEEARVIAGAGLFNKKVGQN